MKKKAKVMTHFDFLGHQHSKFYSQNILLI